MQIRTLSSQKDDARERVEPSYPPQCPLCNGSLILLHSTYRCSRCCYHHCVGCEQIDAGAPSD